MALGARLKLAREARKMTQQELADAVDWDQGAIGNVERRDSKSCRYTAALATALNVDLEWLSTGNGKMQKSGNEAVIIEPSQKDKYTVIPIFTDVALSADAGSCPPDTEFATGYTHMLTDRIRAVGAQPDCIVEAMLDGNSMEPTIMDKSPIKIDTSKSDFAIREGKVYAFSVDGELKVKRLLKTATGDIIIRSDNEMYKDEIIGRKDFEKIARLIGWVFDWPPNEKW
ncbi:helix-turn-helix transcriptional regulator [Psychrobacter sp. FME13]|uniref:XRE family transcriptional regulator n=1 Tax=Psychrobacter sp. FME13 TaxID=2487708 RepID=UPI0017882F82|nr:S24 family peptidase [Psychrobacter sp. FME13]MBE0441440.1 helix-turn-helix transcriptional regulator [Psychrobacter sp. FME13]